MLSHCERIPKHVPAITVHRNCASGMEAISTGAQRLLLGEADIIAAVGVESMSNIPFLFSKKDEGFFSSINEIKTVAQKLKTLASFRLNHLKPDIALELGLTDPICNLLMGNTAENLSREFKISRNDQDEFSLNSHLKALAAQEDGRFDDEIIPVQVPTTYDQTVTSDNGPRQGQNIQALQKLKPYFDRKLGTVTVASSSQITDGAGACLLMRESTPKKRDNSLGYLKGYAYAGCDPHRMGLGPTYATHKLLRQHELTMSDIELVEINEAFAAQVLANVHAFESESFAREELNDTSPVGSINMDSLNVNGGAIALGHPLGASGIRIAVTLLYEMHRRDLTRGLATLCVGGGQGGSFILETQ